MKGDPNAAAECPVTTASVGNEIALTSRRLTSEIGGLSQSLCLRERIWFLFVCSFLFCICLIAEGCVCVCVVAYPHPHHLSAAA